MAAGYPPPVPIQHNNRPLPMVGVQRQYRPQAKKQSNHELQEKQRITGGVGVQPGSSTSIQKGLNKPYAYKTGGMGDRTASKKKFSNHHLNKKSNSSHIIRSQISINKMLSPSTIVSKQSSSSGIIAQKTSLSNNFVRPASATKIGNSASQNNILRTDQRGIRQKKSSTMSFKRVRRAQDSSHQLPRHVNGAQKSRSTVTVSSTGRSMHQIQPSNSARSTTTLNYQGKKRKRRTQKIESRPQANSSSSVTKVNYPHKSNQNLTDKPSPNVILTTLQVENVQAPVLSNLSLVEELSISLAPDHSTLVKRLPPDIIISTTPNAPWVPPPTSTGKSNKTEKTYLETIETINQLKKTTSETKKPTVANKSERTTDKTAKTANQPKKITDQTKKTTPQLKKATDKSEKTIDKSGKTIPQPKKAMLEPKVTAARSEKTTLRTEKTTDKSETANQQPGKLDETPEETIYQPGDQPADQPENIIDLSKTTTDQPEKLINLADQTIDHLETTINQTLQAEATLNPTILQTEKEMDQTETVLQHTPSISLSTAIIL